MAKAIWGLDYDFRADKCFNRPVHNNRCDAPIFFVDGAYRCIGCGEEMELDAEMKKWIDDRSRKKVDTEECFHCHEKTFKAHYYINDVTLEWQLGHGECEKCGMKIIV